MNCPVCGENTRVMDCRADCESVYRRRKCKECNYLFYTTESGSDGAYLKEISNEIARQRRKNKK